MARPSNIVKRLLVVRHAHRDKSEGREKDNGLSSKGQRQAEKLASYLKAHYPVSEAKIFSSPKERCIETVSALGKVKSWGVLDEGDDLNKRAKEFLKWWKEEAPPFVIVSSHGDWIPVFFEIALGTGIELQKGAFAELVLEDGQPRLRTLVQEFE